MSETCTEDKVDTSEDFRPARRIHWYRVPVDPETMRRLSEPDDFKGFVQTGGHLGLAVATFTLTLLVWHYLAWPWVIPVLFLHGMVVSTLGGGGVHELVHGRVFKTQRLNAFFLNVIGWLSWFNPRYVWLSHNEHHKYTLHPPEDSEVLLPIKNRPRDFLLFCTFDIRALYYNIKGLIATVTHRYPSEWHRNLFSERTSEEQQRVVNFAWALLLGHGGVLLVSLLTGYWILFFALSLAPFFGYILTFLLHNSQHYGLMDNVPDFRLCCRSMRLNPVLSFLYWNMNYHTEHHMYPVIPCYNLRKLHEATAHEMPRLRDGLFEAWSEIAGIVVRQKYNPDYQFRTPLPSENDPVTGSDPGGWAKPAAAQAPNTKSEHQESTLVWECAFCGYLYYPEKGAPEHGIEPGTAFNDLPDDWVCPVCGQAKAQFKQISL